jgi:hypothetical protein
MNRGKNNLTSSENIRVKLSRGNAVVVQLSRVSAFAGTVDFQSSLDGGQTWANHPYVGQHSAAPSPSVAQISNPTGPVSYLLMAPVIDTRIVVTYTSGELEVTFREVEV